MKKTILLLSFLTAIICSCLTIFAIPPSGGGSDCPPDCHTDDQICCTTQNGNSFFGVVCKNN